MRPAATVARNRPRTAGGGYHPLPQFEVPPDPTPDWFVKGMTYATSYGDGNAGGEKNLSPGTPSSLSCNPGGEEVSSPPDPHFSVPKDKKNAFQTMGNVFPSIVPSVKIRIPQGILEEEFRRGLGGNLFPKGSPRDRTPSCKTETRGWKGVFDSTIFIPLTVGVRLLFIVMIGIAHPHSQASEASALGGGNQEDPQTEGGRCERQRAYSPPCGSGGEAEQSGAYTPPRVSARNEGGRGERSEPTLLPAFRSVCNPEITFSR